MAENGNGTNTQIRKVVMIMSDSFRRDCLPGIGKKWVHTPVLDAFAQKAVTFNKAYAGSFPTVPNRADIMTGRWAYQFMAWEPLPRHLPTMAETLSSAGCITQSIQDTPVTINNAFNFDRGFQGWQWIRGQDSDNNRSDYTGNVQLLPCTPTKLRQGSRLERRHWLNQHFRRNERDTLVAQTMSSAVDWLEANYKHDEFFLYVDTFDPHEPWDAPEYYLRLYEQEYHGDEVTYPNYWRTSRYKPEEVIHARNLYRAEVTLVDHWLGDVLRKIDTLGIADETAIILTSDHGFYFGEHNYLGKWGEENDPIPIYDEVGGIVMMVYLPGKQYKHGGQCDALVQPVDFLPTIFDLMGKDKPQWAQGHSMVPLLKTRGGVNALHEMTGTSTRLIDSSIKVHTAMQGGFVSITDGEWTLMYGQGGVLPSELYHTAADPKQLKNVIRKNAPVVARLHDWWAENVNQLDVTDAVRETHKIKPLV